MQIFEISNFFLALLIFVQFFNSISNQCSNETEEAHDFVIVGGGTAGCILAARLSENRRFRVALLEAGGEPPLASKIPSAGSTMFNTEVDWKYTSVPQRNALLSYPNQVLNMTRGKMLGGTGSLNGMNYYRGSKLDFYIWKKNGLKDWGWKNVFKYFKKIETDKEIGVNPRYHGYNGPICITNPGQNIPYLSTFFSAVKKLGYKARDPNGDGKLTGYSYTPTNVCNNQRQSTYTKYLKPVINRDNLIVQTFAFVEKIVFDNYKRAIGVIYSKDGCRRFLRAKKEVIVSGGAINSPQLLMLSGIGPRKHLESLNISVVSDLPVGDNLLDHLCINFAYAKPYEDIYNNETIKQFFENKGPLTRFGYGNAFMNTHYSKNYFFPDIQVILHGYEFPVKKGQNLTLTFKPNIARTKSRGIIRLNTSNPYDYPIIDPRYFSDETDLKILAEATKIAVSLMKSMNLSEYGYTPVDYSIQACNQHNTNSDDYWRCLVRHTANTDWHYCGTCRMGPSNRKTSVVDPQLRVIGVERLRVVDASVIPIITSANIQSPIMMIAERAVDFIKSRHN